MSNNNLQQFREQVDKIDKEWLDIVAKRFAVAKQIGEYKAANNMPALDQSRENEQYTRIRKLAEEKGVNPDLAETILREIIAEVRKNHEEIATRQN